MCACLALTSCVRGWLATLLQIIIASDSRPEVLTQFLSRMYSAGYAHVLLVLRHEIDCTLLARHFEDLGCAWYNK